MSSSVYAQDIGEISILSKEESLRLIESMKSGDAIARKKFIKHNMRIILSVVGTLYSEGNLRCGFTEEDMISIGTIGLIHAVDSFDPKISSFSTFAYNSIRNEIMHELVKQNRKKRKAVTVSLDEPFNGDDDFKLEELIPDDRIDVEDEVITTIRRKTIREALDRLTTEEKELLAYRYGLYDGEKHSLRSTGKKYNLTHESIRQKEGKVLKKLQSKKLKELL